MRKAATKSAKKPARSNRKTPTAAKRSSRHADRQSPKPFLILNGRMEMGFNPQSPTDLPDNPWLQDGGIIGEYATAQDAIAEAIRQNQVFLDCNLSDMAWSMVVVRLDSGKAVSR